MDSREKPRLGTVRSASEQPRSRMDGSSARHETQARQESHRRSLRVDTQEEPQLLSPDVYDAVNRSLEQRPDEQRAKQQAQPLLNPASYYQQRSKSKARLDTHRPVSIEEECEDDEYPDSAVSGIPPGPGSSSTLKGSFSPASLYESREPPLAFEIVAPRSHSHYRSESRRRQQVDMTKIRVKVHGERDTRYVMTTPATTFVEFLEQIRKKFGLLCGEASEGKTGEFKLKMRDEEGDMVTMGDQEDLEMAVQACRDTLLAGGVEDAYMGKMEVCVDCPPPFPPTLCGFKKVANDVFVGLGAGDIDVERDTTHGVCT